jgi:hypothetical protein
MQHSVEALETSGWQQTTKQWVGCRGDTHLAGQQAAKMLQSVAIPPGVGKTYVACALAHAAIRRGHSALYVRAPRLFDEIAIARADGRLQRLMATWARVATLVIDDFLLRPLSPDQAADMLEVIEDRCGLRSTIITSQLPVSLWHEALGDATIADAVLDRLLEKAHRIELHGESMRSSGAAHDDGTSAPKTKARTAKPPAPKRS